MSAGKSTDQAYSKEDTFVEKFVTFRKVVAGQQLQQAKALVAADPEKPLLRALLELGLISEADSKLILQLYEKSLAGQPPPAARAVVPPTERPPPAASPGATEVEPAPAPVPAIPAADAARINAFEHLHDYLSYAREMEASDLHITAAAPPVLRKYGRLVSLPRDPLTPQQTERLLFQILTEEQKRSVENDKALEFCYRVPDHGRYRSCILQQRMGWDGAFRVISSAVPTFDALGLPEQLQRLTEFNQGLVLITGPKGCGKSTTMATMVDLINRNRSEHIITIEDPVEYNFVPLASQINQREVGAHTKSFAAALRAALREDPDVIVIGELRDRETVSLAITAAETGHLVFGTMHTTSAARTIDRILDVFPPDEQPQIRSMISESIRGIVCQQLIPRKDGSGRALALEVMLNTVAVSNLIRERKLFQIPSIIQTSRQQGMILLDNSLLELVNAGVIDGVEAYYASDNKAHFLRWAPKIDGMAAEG